MPHQAFPQKKPKESLFDNCSEISDYGYPPPLTPHERIYRGPKPIILIYKIENCTGEYPAT